MIPLPLWVRQDAPWVVVFLTLAAEAARAGAHLLDHLHAAAAVRAALTRGQDRRARLADALDAVLATPLLTPQALAEQLQRNSSYWST